MFALDYWLKQLADLGVSIRGPTNDGFFTTRLPGDRSSKLWYHNTVEESVAFARKECGL